MSKAKEDTLVLPGMVSCIKEKRPRTRTAALAMTMWISRPLHSLLTPPNPSPMRPFLAGPGLTPEEVITQTLKLVRNNDEPFCDAVHASARAHTCAVSHTGHVGRARAHTHMLSLTQAMEYVDDDAHTQSLSVAIGQVLVRGLVADFFRNPKP